MSREIRIGLLAIVSIGLLIWGYKYLLGQNLLNRSQTFYIEYDNINNLKVSDPVTVNGFQVGTVQDVFLKPEDLQTVIVKIDIQSGILLPQNTVAELTINSMMGSKSIVLSYSGVCTDDCKKSGDYINGKSLSLLQSFVKPREIDTYFGRVQDGIGGVVDSLNAHLLQDDSSEIGRSIHDLRSTIANLNLTTYRLNQLLAHSSDKLVGVLDNLEKITTSINDNNGEIAGFLQNANDITNQLKTARLDSTIVKTNRTLAGTEIAVSSLQETLESAADAFANLDKLIAQINAGDGTLGQLMVDKALYQNLNETSRNLNLLLQDFRLNPKRYVNVSVFGKKQKEYTVPEDDPAQTSEDTSKQ